MTNKEKVYTVLQEAGIPFESMEHVAVYTMEEVAKAGIPRRGVLCKNLFLREHKGRRHYLVCVPEETQVDLKALAERLGEKSLSFASAERLEKYLGVTQGAVSPLGVLNDESRSVVVLFDAALEGAAQVDIHPNDNTATIWLSFADLRRVIEDHGNEIRLLEF